MKIAFITIVLTALMLFGCQSESTTLTVDGKEKSCCSFGCTAKSKSKEISCKLTSPELQERKATVLESLKKQISDTKELENGYAFKFPGTDAVLDELMAFIKTERACCDFFTFNLSISGDKSEVWLELIGMDGAKDFIKRELGKLSFENRK